MRVYQIFVPTLYEYLLWIEFYACDAAVRGKLRFESCWIIDIKYISTGWVRHILSRLCIYKTHGPIIPSQPSRVKIVKTMNDAIWLI